MYLKKSVEAIRSVHMYLKKGVEATGKSEMCLEMGVVPFNTLIITLGWKRSCTLLQSFIYKHKYRTSSAQKNRGQKTLANYTNTQIGIRHWDDIMLIMQYVTKVPMYASDGKLKLVSVQANDKCFICENLLF